MQQSFSQQQQRKLPLPSLLLKKTIANAAAAAAVASSTENNNSTRIAETKTGTRTTTAGTAAATTTTTTTTPREATTNAILTTNENRRCIFDCDDNSVVLCRFPVHDQRRCNNWLKFFKITPDFVKKHGLLNLRVCLKHFHQQNQMAKTRMKTTPTRLQKDALTTAEDIKKRLRQVNSTKPKQELLQVTSSVLVTPPKRTNSISSATSSVSLASDGQSGHSDSEFATGVATPKAIEMTGKTTKPPPTKKTPISSSKTSAAIITANRTNPSSTSLLQNQQPAMSKQPGNLIKNRKIFMITEKSDEIDNETDPTTNHSQTNGGQKRKMYLIMDESPEQSADINDDSIGDYNKNEFNGNATKKKLTLYADKCDAQLTQKFEQILPEILSRINSKVKDQASCVQNAPTTTPIVNGVSATVTAKQNGRTIVRAGPPPPTPTDHGSSALIKAESTKEPITLPPKKNRMKIINTAALPNANTAPTAQSHISAAATPVIVSTEKLLGSNGKLVMENKTIVGNIVPLPSHQKNINLSADFLFLMKMLPKLEAIPEPHKNHVKNCIEKIVTQNAALFHD